MRGDDIQNNPTFVLYDIETRLPQDHPLRTIKALVDPILERLSPDFDKMYSWTGRPSIPPEQLLRAMILQTLYTIRSERLLVEEIDFNLAYRCAAWLLRAWKSGSVRQSNDKTPAPSRVFYPWRRIGMRRCRILHPGQENDPGIQ